MYQPAILTGRLRRPILLSIFIPPKAQLDDKKRSQSPLEGEIKEKRGAGKNENGLRSEKYERSVVRKVSRSLVWGAPRRGCQMCWLRASHAEIDKILNLKNSRHRFGQTPKIVGNYI
jgi:hypothetical protein